jgi:hypothetical protein
VARHGSSSLLILVGVPVRSTLYPLAHLHNIYKKIAVCACNIRISLLEISRIQLNKAQTALFFLNLDLPQVIEDLGVHRRLDRVRADEALFTHGLLSF